MGDGRAFVRRKGATATEQDGDATGLKRKFGDGDDMFGDGDGALPAWLLAKGRGRGMGMGMGMGSSSWGYRSRDDEDSTCWDFVRGFCPRGDKCRYLHAIAEAPQEQKDVTFSVPSARRQAILRALCVSTTGWQWRSLRRGRLNAQNGGVQTCGHRWSIISPIETCAMEESYQAVRELSKRAVEWTCSGGWIWAL